MNCIGKISNPQSSFWENTTLKQLVLDCELQSSGLVYDVNTLVQEVFLFMLKKRERRTAVNGKSYPSYTLEQAIDYVILRTLKAIFNQLEKDDIIEINPVGTNYPNFHRIAH